MSLVEMPRLVRALRRAPVQPPGVDTCLRLIQHASSERIRIILAEAADIFVKADSGDLTSLARFFLLLESMRNGTGEDEGLENIAQAAVKLGLDFIINGAALRIRDVRADVSIIAVQALQKAGSQIAQF